LIGVAPGRMGFAVALPSCGDFRGDSRAGRFRSR
jgi:hypothetical protein